MSNTLNVRCPEKNEDGDYDHDIEVEVDYQPEERMTQHYPGAPESWDFFWPHECPTCGVVYTQKHIDLIIERAQVEFKELKDGQY